MKVLLMRPYADSDELIPPIGLGYLATALRKNHEVEILDGIKERLNLEKFEEILKEGHYDVVGIDIFTFQIKQAKEHINLIRKIIPDAKIILGGPHPSCSSENIFEFFPNINWAFRGEAEVGLVKLLDLVVRNQLQREKLATVPGLIWRDGGQTIINQQFFVENLDELGMPSWDLLKPETYPLAPHGAFFKNYPIAPLIISRGCPYSCTFCAGHLVSGKKIRFRSAANVIEEVKLLYHKYGIREIHIEDDNFTLNHELVREFCRLLKENHLNISWTCPNGVRLDSLTEELLLTMKDAGLYSLSVGVESGSDRILSLMKKNLTREQMRQKIALIKKCGLEVSGFFIIGYPGETKKDIMDTINFSIELGLKRAGFSLFKPFPGTEITKELAAHGELKEMSDEDWSNFVLADAIYAPSGFTRAQMKKLRRQALIKFYLRPEIIFKFLSEIKNFKHLRVVLKRIYSWLFKAR